MFSGRKMNLSSLSRSLNRRRRRENLHVPGRSLNDLEAPKSSSNRKEREMWNTDDPVPRVEPDHMT